LGTDREYLKEKVNDLATNSKNKNIRDLFRGINEFKRSYQPRNNVAKDGNGVLLADSHILKRWKNYFSQSLNVHSISQVRQTEIHTDDPSPFEVQNAIAKLISTNCQVVITFW
jgi:hypothetical protein